MGAIPRKIGEQWAGLGSVLLPSLSSSTSHLQPPHSQAVARGMCWEQMGRGAWAPSPSCPQPTICSPDGPGHCGGGNPSPASPKPCPDELGHNYALVQESEFIASSPPPDQEFCFVKKVTWPPGEDLCSICFLFHSHTTPPGLHTVSLPRTLLPMMFKHHPAPSQADDCSQRHPNSNNIKSKGRSSVSHPSQFILLSGPRLYSTHIHVPTDIHVPTHVCAHALSPK